MKIDLNLLTEKCGVTRPRYAEHIDLSSCNIVTLEGLKTCTFLRTIILSNNSISIIPKFLSKLPELWKLDLSHNLVSSLDGLINFRCIGTLILSYNNISWEELRKIQHLIILNLYLIGNPKLEKDNYYRRHVIDCLPNVWMLDGILVTAPERQQVKSFFQDSEILARPVRRKLRPLTASKFIPSHMKKLSSKAVLGHFGTQLMSKFSITEKQTIATDKRRLVFLAETIESDLCIQRNYWKQLQNMGHEIPPTATPIPGYLSCRLDDFTLFDKNLNETDAGVVSSPFPPQGFGLKPPFSDLLEIRKTEIERCNMLLIIMVSALEFSLPVALLEETLKKASLARIGNINCLALIQLPHSEVLLTCSLLLSAIIVDRGEGEEGGLYKRLYISLYIILSNLFRCTHGHPAFYNLKYMSPSVHRALLAAEVVQLMCLVPNFINMIDTDQGIVDLIAIATQNPHIKDVISNVIWNNDSAENFNNDVCGVILHYVRMSIEENCYEIMDLENGLVPYHRPQSVISLPSKRVVKQRAKSCLAFRRRRNNRSLQERVPQLGDNVALPRLRRGRIVGLHQEQLALVQVSAQPIASVKDAYGEYVYIDLQFMKFDVATNSWKQQEHVQEYAPQTRIEHVERCYSVTSKRSDRSSKKEWSYVTEPRQETISEIGAAYQVPETRNLKIHVDEEAVRYMEERSQHSKSVMGGPSNTVQADSSVGENNSVSTHDNSDMPKVPDPQEATNKIVSISSGKDEILAGIPNENELGNDEELDDKDLEIEQLPMSESNKGDLNKKEKENVKLFRALTNEAGPIISPDLLLLGDTKTKDEKKNSNTKITPKLILKDEVVFRSFDRPLPQGNIKHMSYRNPAWSRAPVSSRSSNRPATRQTTASSRRYTSKSGSSQPPADEDYCLLTQPKSLPDVSGISLFSYSMGGIGVIRPPDCTVHKRSAAEKFELHRSATQKTPR